MNPELPFKPTRAQLEAARGKRVPDVIAPGLKVLFAGINPGLYTAAVGHHFARPGNRFWPALHAGGFTPRVLSPFEEQDLLAIGFGITNVVDRPTATADELTPDELKQGGTRLRDKARQFHPKALAILGIGAYRAAFAQPRAQLGRQPDPVGTITLWVLPNPSGLNAHYQGAELARLFRQLRDFVR